MANGVLGQIAVLSVSLSILICALILYRRRKPTPEPLPRGADARLAVEQTQSTRSKPAPITAVPKSAELVRPAARMTPVQAEATNVEAKRATETAPIHVVKPAEVIDMQGALLGEDGRNERILAGISENIRKSLQLRAVPNPSPILYSESKPRNTEYVRVKKEIITPHGHIRFSILKDWMSTNMLAVFRRASLEWKTPDDLIALIPAYLEPNAEILSNEILLIGTEGHNEKLAVPMHNLDAPHLRDCFDFISGGPLAANTPAVLLTLEDGFQVVSKGVITRAAFTNSIDSPRPATRFLDEASAEALQKKYNAALLRMERSVVAERVTEQPVQ